MDILDKIKSHIKNKDVFLSFRNSINVSLINPNNSFNTPTGIYTYPSSDYRSKILESNTMEEFYEIFPFKGRYEPKHLYIYELKSNCVVFDNETTLSELKPYYEQIMKLYSKDEYRKITFDYLKDYINGIKKNPEKELYGYRLFFNYDIRDEKGSEIHKFWTLTYNLTDDEPNVWGNLFRKIGIDAFIDHGEGYIHPNEPHQGLLLKSRGIFQDITVIDLIDDNKSKNEIKKDLSENKNPSYSEMIDCYQKDPGFVLSILLNYAKKLNFEVVNHYEDILKDSRNKKPVDDILTYYYDNFTIENSLDLFRHHDILKLLLKKYGEDFLEKYFTIRPQVKDRISLGGDNNEKEKDIQKRIQLACILRLDPHLVVDFLDKNKQFDYSKQLDYFEDKPEEIDDYKDGNTYFFKDVRKSSMFNFGKDKEEEREDKDLEHKYELFKDTYEKTTGVAWSESKFKERARNWDFYGDYNGYVAVRHQMSGAYKLVGSAGSVTSVARGLGELTKKDISIWGMMTEEMADILVKRYDFFRPPNFLVKTILKFISPKTFGGVDIEIEKDGGVTFNYEDVGKAKKYFVANKKYYTDYLITRDFVENNKIVKKALNFFIKMYIKK